MHIITINEKVWYWDCCSKTSFFDVTSLTDNHKPLFKGENNQYQLNIYIFGTSLYSFLCEMYYLIFISIFFPNSKFDLWPRFYKIVTIFHFYDMHFLIAQVIPFQTIYNLSVSVLGRLKFWKSHLGHRTIMNKVNFKCIMMW